MNFKLNSRFYFIAFVVPQILTEICSDDITPSLHLENQQAIVKQFSEIIEFVLKFDEYKVQYSVAVGTLNMIFFFALQFCNRCFV